MILIDHFFFFCIITNCLHPASNYLGIFFSFLIQESHSAASYVFGLSVLGFSPQFFCVSNCVFVFISIAVCCLRCMFVLVCRHLSQQGNWSSRGDQQMSSASKETFFITFLCPHFFFPRWAVLSVLLGLGIESPNTTA